MTAQSFYESAWHHPGLAWLLVLPTAFAISRVRDAATKRVLALFAATTALDAWLTGALSPLDPASLLARNVSIAFVIWGDARLFVLLEKWRADTSWVRAWLRGAAWSFVVPVAQAVALRARPELFPERRHIFLVYELLFVALATALLATRYARTRQATALLTFFLAQYALWVLSDVLLLAGHAWAAGLRVVPNALYYGGFLFFAARRAEARP